MKMAELKANQGVRTADFFSLAQRWYLSGMHTDITVRCAGWTHPVFKCHKIIIGEILIRELGTDLSQLEPEVDQLIIPDILPNQFEEFIRFLYGFERDYKEKQFSHEVHLHPLQVKVKLEEEETAVEPVNDAVPFISVSQLQGNVGKETTSKVCPYCQKCFKRHDHLTRHLLQHTGERPYQCNLCEKAFTRKDKLNHHYKKGHGDQVFVCFCSKIFFTELQYEEHIKSNPDHFQEPSERGLGGVVEASVDESPPVSPVPHQAQQFQYAVPINQNIQGCEGEKLEGEGEGEEAEEEMHFKTEVDELDMADEMDHIDRPPLQIDTDGIKRDLDEKDDVKPDITKKQKRKKKKVGEVENDESETRRQYPCQYCHVIFTTLKKRKAHYIGDHYELLKENGLLFTHNKIVRVKVHVCPVDGCERSFRHSCEVQDHVNVVHKKEKNYVCELCSKAFPYKKSLRNHMDLKHDVHKKEAILCPKCGDIFNSKAKLSAHIASKHKVRVAKFMCKFCDFKTHAKNVITEHERTHTGEKPEICQWCGKGFNAKKTLRNHERLHTGEKPYQCKLCTSSFAQRTSLNVHMNSHHKTELPDELNKDEKPYLYKYNSNSESGDPQQQQRLYQLPQPPPLEPNNSHQPTADQNDNNSVIVKNEHNSSSEPPGSLHHTNISEQRLSMKEPRSGVVSDYSGQQIPRDDRQVAALQPQSNRTKVGEEATLFSLKALNKLKNNETAHSTGQISYPAWMKQ